MVAQAKGRRDWQAVRMTPALGKSVDDSRWLSAHTIHRLVQGYGGMPSGEEKS